ncbi:MAG TPA: protein kinase [Terriglobales bacterium]|nr:protein kinase [Terriglobales bacterium]
MAASIPKKIGKYDVLDVIGKGGMGIVYRAKDPFLDRMVAIKIMTISYADYPDLLQRFYREAKATANLQHPNIVTVYELGEHEGSPYLAMQYLEGASLETLLRSGQQLSLLQKIDVVVQACHGLSYAHQRGIIHRDIKPGNIMVLKDGSVKIVDFGIARIGDTNFTRTGQFMGSLNYMSLEQLNDKLQVDQRTDVYSTGVVLYQILTGALPFEADSTGATLMKILNEAPPPFARFISGYPPEIETITMKALAKDRDQRYGSAEELAFDLSQLQDHMKQEQVAVHMQRAELSLQQNDLFQANDELLEVLKLDKQHSRASSMLRTLRKQIEKEQSAERARQLRQQAEEAFGREDFDPALGFLDQAINLDPANTDLQGLRSKVQAAKEEIEHLRQVMQRAENARRAGNLDTAKQAIEEVLARRPNDTRVQSLYRMIQKELEERLRQKRMENLLETARKEMANRQYTAAFDILKEAEKVDPDAPALRSLQDTLTTAREQEQRRKALDDVTRQAEQALNTDDHQAALNLLAEGLKRFPGEPALLKLRELAENQKQAAQTKSYVRERISAAREILNAGNATGAIKVLQDALKKVPGNPHLESLVSIAQERQAQDRDDEAKARCIHQANEALDRHAYDEAIELLEAGQVRFAASQEIDSRLRFAREQRAKVAKQQEVERSVRSAQEFLRAQEYDRAIELLESAIARAPDEELGIVLEEARRRRDDFNLKIAAAVAKGQQFLQEGSPAKAVEFLQAQPTSFRKSDEFRDLLLAAASQNRIQKPEEPIVPVADLEAPEPAKTMMWDTTAPPEIEKPQAPRVPTGRITPPIAPPAKTVPAKTAPLKTAPPRPAAVAAPGLLQRLTKVQKILIASAAGVALFIVLAIVLWPHSKAVTPTAEGSSETAPPPKPAVATGTLSVQTTEDGVDVFVDDELKGSTTGKKLSVTIPAGQHTVEVQKSGFDVVPPQAVDVASNNEALLTFTLTASKTPSTREVPKDSYLMITGTPGAEVRVDGVAKGSLSGTPMYVKVSPDSAHHVEARLSGYKSFSKNDVSVRAGDRAAVIAQLEALPKMAASIVSFTGPGAPIQPGQNARISWVTRNARQVDIDGIGSNLEPSGSRDIPLTQNRTFRLVAKGDAGNDTRNITVTVATPVLKAPTVTSFTANPATIKQGDSTILAWSTTDAHSVAIEGLAANLPANGVQRVSPTQNTRYNLSAMGDGGNASYSLTVTVQPPQPKPTADQNSAETDIQATLNRLSDAYATEDLTQVLKVWPKMNGKAKSQIKELFKSVRAFKIVYGPCDSPSVSEDRATIVCTKVQSYNAEGKYQTAPPVKVLISLRKSSSGAWQVENETGK